MSNSQTHLSRGAQIEVTKAPNAPHYPATVLDPPSTKKRKLLVEYQTLYDAAASAEAEGGEDRRKRVSEYVDIEHVRPMQPRELNKCYKVGDVVEAWYLNGWCKGVVRDILENSMYVVKVDGGNEFEFGQWDLRVHRVWDSAGSWVPPLEVPDETDPEPQQKKGKPGKLRITFKFSNDRKAREFGLKQPVEVSSDEEGYQGAWFGAKIVDFIGNDKYLVEYLTLRTADLTVPLREEAYARYIRPFPPTVQTDGHYTLLEEVDAWYNDGWWVGVVTNVLLSHKKYSVYFRYTNEELIFDHCNLRPHLDWKDGKWVNAVEKKSNYLGWRSGEVQFSKGTKVEVRSDQEGYKGSWFSATIFEQKTNDRYLIEYETLKTDDETEFLKEEAAASDIRLRPPKFRHKSPFRMLQEVDAWYNEGWWEGCILKVLGKSKYAVYFKTTNEVLEFQHRDLRLHQEWINGEWITFSGYNVSSGNQLL